MRAESEKVRKQMNEIFADPETSLPAQMKFDFRKICAKYICVADDREFLCTRFESTASGLCKFKDDVFCSSL
jgi:hypothetical protein